MNPRASNTNKTITRDNSIPKNQLLLLADSRRKTDKIKTAILGKQLGHDCGFSPDNRHSRLLRALDQTNSHLFHNRSVRLVHGHVVEEADGLRARADQIIGAHRNAINPIVSYLPIISATSTFVPTLSVCKLKARPSPRSTSPA